MIIIDISIKLVHWYILATTTYILLESLFFQDFAIKHFSNLYSYTFFIYYKQIKLNQTFFLTFF